MQRWRKLGRVFVADGRSDWMASHASYPTALPLEGAVVRIFFSPRDRENRSSIAFLDLAIEGDRREILRMGDRPLLSPGQRGAFDDSGVTPGSVVGQDGQTRLYYLGWSLSVTVPFRNFIGLAESDPGAEAFRRVSVAPVLDRSAADPFTLGYPWVLAERDGWRMWYGSHLQWGEQGLDMVHVIKTASCIDGVEWRASGEIAVDLTADKGEYALSRPTVLRDGPGYRMWYSRRLANYRMGYAESPDGRTWTRRDDEVGLQPSPDGWDSEAICYPCVFRHQSQMYMLYNGNGYGRSGFGLARLEE